MVGGACDLVEEDGAAIGLHEFSILRRPPGEAPPLWPNSSLSSSVSESAASDFDERFVRRELRRWIGGRRAICAAAFAG